MKTPSRPLEGIKVVDISRVLAGPFCTQILGDLGAEVLKIEKRDGGDDTRSWGPPFFNDQSVYYLSANRNKKTRFLDFHRKEDLSVVLKALRSADVLVENFKVGSLKKFGLDYESIQPQFPRLIYASITGFGQSGPRAHEPGYDALIQGMGGMMSVNGSEGAPTKVGVAIADIAAGLYTCIGILAALREREISGIGQRLDISLLESQMGILSYLAMNYLVTKEPPRPLGNAHPSIVPYQSFETADRPLMITVGNDQQFENFCRVLEVDWFHDSRFCTNDARVRHRNVLVSKIQEKLRQKPRNHWLMLFHGKGFPYGPVQNFREIEKDPQVVTRKIFGKMDDGQTPNIKSPLNFSRTPVTNYALPVEITSTESAEE